MNTKPQILFLSHGGGPMPLLGDVGHKEMIDCLQKISSILRKPSAILVVSAHWEEKIPTMTSGANPSLINDYYVFPEQSYSITYPCQGRPSLAEQTYKRLDHSVISAKLDGQRCFDHRLCSPLKIMYPDVDSPWFPLSLADNLSPAAHIRIGRSIEKLC